MKTLPYTITLSFTKLFTSGSYKGSTLSETLGFVSKQRAQDWLNGIARNSKAGILDYKIASSNINEL